MRPDFSRIGDWYHGYIGLVEDSDINDAFARQSPQLIDFFQSIAEYKRGYKYAAGKWDLFQMLQHIIDAERIFSYRALRLARKDTTPLPGFDENQYADNSNSSARSWDSLVEELRIVRQSSELLFRNFDPVALDQSGTVSNSPAYVLGIGYIIIGHSMHHEKVVKERYLGEK